MRAWDARARVRLSWLWSHAEREEPAPDFGYL
jgi:hypothetical protein